MFCSECGTRQQGEAPAPAPVVEEPQQSSFGSPFGSFFAAPTRIQAAVCRSCNTPLEAGTIFCSECGARQ